MTGTKNDRNMTGVLYGGVQGECPGRCSIITTLDHMFVHCPSKLGFWNSFQNWWETKAIVSITSDNMILHLIQKGLLWALAIVHWEATVWANENNQMLCLSDRQTIASQLKMPNSQCPKQPFLN